MIGIPLSITYDQKVYMFYIVSAPNKNKVSFEILLEGRNYSFVLDDRQAWIENTRDGENTLDDGLIQKIAKACLVSVHR